MAVRNLFVIIDKDNARGIVVGNQILRFDKRRIELHTERPHGDSGVLNLFMRSDT